MQTQQNGPAPIAAYRKQVQEAADTVRIRWDKTPQVGVILGTGLGKLSEDIEVEVALSYEDLPHMPAATVEQHEGRLLLGQLEGVPVVAMQGRFHLYEGYSPRQVTLPVRVMALLGVDTLLISNAAGGMDPQHAPGDLLLVTDHINFMGVNPLTGPNVEAWGPRFPDMSVPYDPDLRAAASRVALESGMYLHQGVYVSVIGPNLETPAEYRFLRLMGADVVGMSTVPEVIVARHMGLRVLAISVITDRCLPDALEPVDIDRIMEAAATAEPKLAALMKGVVAELDVPVS